MSAKIFVGNLHPKTTKSDLARFFSAMGRVASVSLPVDDETGRSRGFAFVEFADRDSAEEVLAMGDGRELEGRRLRLSPAREGHRAGRERRAEWRRVSERDSEVDDEPDDVGHSRSRRSSGPDDDYKDKRRRERPRRHGKHGSDRKRSYGTKREID